MVGGIGCGSSQTPQTFTTILLSVAEWFFFKSSEHALHPAQKLFLRKIGIKSANQFAPLQYYYFIMVLLPSNFSKKNIVNTYS